MEYLTIGNRDIPYTLIRTSRRKSIGIEVSPKNGVIVRAPKKLSRGRIRELLESSSGWIQKRIEQLEKSPEARTRNFANGDKFLFLGQWVAMHHIPVTGSEIRLRKTADGFVVQVPTHLANEEKKLLVRDALIRWYRKEARNILAERVAHFALQVGVPAPPFIITNAGRRWGSCGINGRLNFPWRLIMAPLSLLDYVVVHELCHLKRRDHSAVFWQHVKDIMPDFRERRKKLRAQGILYDL